MEEEHSGEGRKDAAAWEHWVAYTLRFTLPSSRANSNHPLAVLPSMDPSVMGGKSQSPYFPYILRSFQYGDILIRQQKRD
ncbi:Hypothetical predicted protein [Marmota monax]|uniref:Uncharacterized protein n=1 Tax=Marmota monax TaxID=9995 RepID=A0A5E4CR07_MARMO|nr:hypothetical protein GHT09_010948 [Marmota monax]VTJ83382.1 Hypothetical predicted protein [Marmota monax]